MWSAYLKSGSLNFLDSFTLIVHRTHALHDIRGGRAWAGHAVQKVAHLFGGNPA